MKQIVFQHDANPNDPALPIRPASNGMDIRARLLHALQQFFESSRDQFDQSDLRTPEWRQADDAIERAYDACVARETIPTIKSLCSIARRYVDMAVEMSTARSYYDGRI